MGTAAVKGWPPTGVVTLVLAGGRVEEFKRPILAGDIMIRHPRHHVVRPDFFRSSPVVVVKPEEVLMPGNKFFLVPFHTVLKKMSKNVEVLHSSSVTPSSGASVAGGADPSSASDQPRATRDINRSRHVSVGTQCSVKTERKDLAGVAQTVTRSPAGRASVLRKNSPTTSLQARKTLLHKESSRNYSRKRLSGDSGDFARMRSMSLQSRMRRDSNGGSPAEFTDNASLDSSNLTELQSFRTADFAESKVSIESLDLTKQSPPSELSTPEYASFQSSLRSSRELSFQQTVPAVTEHESFGPMDFSEAEKNSIQSLLPTTAALVKKLAQSFEATNSYSSEKNSREPILSKTITSVDGHESFEEHKGFEAMDSCEPEKSSSETPLRMPTRSSPDGFASALGMKERIMDSRGGDSGLDHQTRTEDLSSRFDKTSRPASSMKMELTEQKPTIKRATTSSTFVKNLVQSFEATDSSSSEKNSREPILPKTVILVEEHESFEAVDSSEPEKSSSEPLLRIPTPSPDHGFPSALSMKERMDSQGGNSRLDHQTRKEDLSRFNKSPTRASSMEMELKLQQKPTIKMATTGSTLVKKLVQSFEATDLQSPSAKNSSEPILLQTVTSVERHQSFEAIMDSSEPENLTSSETPLRTRTPSPHGYGSVLGMKERMDSRGGETPLRMPTPPHGYDSVLDMKERMDSRGGESRLRMQTPPDGYASVLGMKERMDSRGGDTPLRMPTPPHGSGSVLGLKERIYSRGGETQWRMPTPPRGYGSVLGLKERIDSRGGETPLRMPTPPQGSDGSVLGLKQRIESRGGETPLRMLTPPHGYGSVLGMKERMDSRGGETRLRMPTSPHGSGSVLGMKERMDSRGGETALRMQVTSLHGSGSVLGMKERIDSRGGGTALRMQVTSPHGYGSVLGMKEKMDSRGGDSGLDTQARKEDLSRINKPPRPAPLMKMEFKQQKLTFNVVADAQQAMSHSGRQNGSRQQATSGEKKVTIQEQLERCSSAWSAQRAPQQQQEVMEDQANGLKGLQHAHKGARNSKFEVNALDNGSLFKSSPVASKPSTPVQANKPSVTLVKKQKPYRQKLIERLCFSSSQYMSPLHVHAAGGNTEKQIKAKLKLIDHLRLQEPASPPMYVQKLYQQSPLHAHATKVRGRQALPTPPRFSGSGRQPKAQVNQAPVKIELDPFVLRSFDHVKVDVDVAPIEEKFLKLPPMGFLRRRRIRTRKRGYKLTNWKPRLSPLVEFSP